MKMNYIKAGKGRKSIKIKTGIVLFAFISGFVISAFAGGAGYTGEQEIIIDWSVFQSEYMNITIPEAPKIELKQVGNVYLASADGEIDRLLYTHNDEYGSVLISTPHTADGYVINERDITYCFAQIGNIIYHYNFPRYIRSTFLEADYATVLHAKGDLYLADGYPVTSSGWFREYDGYRINIIESGDLCAVIDAFGTPLYYYLYVRPNDWKGTASMDPDKYPTPKEAYHYYLSSDEQRSYAKDSDYNLKKYEEVVPKTLKEAEVNWNVTFPYCPELNSNAEEQTENPNTVNAIIQKNLINENYHTIELYLDDDIFTTTTQFDHIEGFNTSPIDSYDWQHITNGNEYFFIYQGRYIYTVYVWVNPLIHDERVESLYIEDNDEANDDVEVSFSAITYVYTPDHLVDTNGLHLLRYRLDDYNAITLDLRSKEREEYTLTFNIQTGRLESIKNTNAFNSPEWYTYFYP